MGRKMYVRFLSSFCTPSLVSLPVLLLFRPCTFVPRHLTVLVLLPRPNVRGRRVGISRIRGPWCICLLCSRVPVYSRFSTSNNSKVSFAQAAVRIRIFFSNVLVVWGVTFMSIALMTFCMLNFTPP